MLSKEKFVEGLDSDKGQRTFIVWVSYRIHSQIFWRGKIFFKEFSFFLFKDFNEDICSLIHLWFSPSQSLINCTTENVSLKLWPEVVPSLWRVFWKAINHFPRLDFPSRTFSPRFFKRFFPRSQIQSHDDDKMSKVSWLFDASGIFNQIPSEMHEKIGGNFDIVNQTVLVRKMLEFSCKKGKVLKKTHVTWVFNTLRSKIIHCNVWKIDEGKF